MKGKLKIAADVLMAAGMLFMSGYHLWGGAVHEWGGAGIFTLFIFHHILNFNFYKSLFKGKFSTFRITLIIIDFLTLVAMLALMYSGITMSRYVFAFLKIKSGLAIARRLHILGSYWGILIMGLHLGLHWSMFLSIADKKLKINSASKIRNVICFSVGAFIACCGAYVMIKRDFFTYMFLKGEFVFLDYEESKVLFYLDYFSVMSLCVFMAHYFSRLLKIITLKKKNIFER